MFTERFGSFVYVGDQITTNVSHYKVTATIASDVFTDIDDDDSHNVDQSVTGCNDEQFKELLAARQAWINDEWFYCGIVLSVSSCGVVLCDGIVSTWGVEANYPGSNNNHLTDVANELLPEAIAEAEKVLFRLVNSYLATRR